MKLTTFEKKLEFLLSFFFVSRAKKLTTKGGNQIIVIDNTWLDSVISNATAPGGWYHNMKNNPDNKKDFVNSKLYPAIADPALSGLRLLNIISQKVTSGVTTLTATLLFIIVLSMLQKVSVSVENDDIKNVVHNLQNAVKTIGVQQNAINHDISLDIDENSNLLDIAAEVGDEVITQATGKLTDELNSVSVSVLNPSELTEFINELTTTSIVLDAEA